jgi:hypothetical protein
LNLRQPSSAHIFHARWRLEKIFTIIICHNEAKLFERTEPLHIPR